MSHCKEPCPVDICLEMTKAGMCGYRSPLSRPCPACGAKPGKPCLSIESKEAAMQREFVGVLYREEREMHEARRSK